MLDPFRAAARFIDQKIGWNRIGFVLSLVIIVAAAVVLYRILRGIDIAEVLEALKATETSRRAAGRPVRRGRLFHAHLL